MKKSIVIITALLTLLCATACTNGEPSLSATDVAGTTATPSVTTTMPKTTTTTAPITTETPITTEAPITTIAPVTTNYLPTPVDYANVEVAWGRNVKFFKESLKDSEYADDVKNVDLITSFLDSGCLDIDGFEVCSILYEITNPNQVDVDKHIYTNGGYEYFAVRLHDQNCRCRWLGIDGYTFGCIECIELTVEIRPTAIEPYIPEDYDKMDEEGFSAFGLQEYFWTYYSPNDAPAAKLITGKYIVYAGDNMKINLKVQATESRYVAMVMKTSSLIRYFAK